MKKALLAMLVVFTTVGMIFTSNAIAAYNFGDFRSETLVAKAWQALNQDDIEAVLAYSNKTLELYGEQAKKFQAELNGYPEGSTDLVFSYWALNDVATAVFVQAEAYRNAGMIDEAREAYQKVIKNYTYGQAWDSKGWFWRPAEAAKEKLAMLESGTSIAFGDNSSSHLTGQAWQAFNSGDYDAVMIYTDKVLDMYEEQAREQQESLTEYAWESKDKIFSFWALNDVGTALFIKGEAFKKQGKAKEAKQAYKKLVDAYYYAQCWDPNGWFWKPAEAAQQAIDELST